MSKTFNDKLGQTGASAPSAIANSQNIHSAGVAKVSQTLPATPFQIVTDSTVDIPVADCDVLRVANTTGSVQYLNVRSQEDAAPGAVDISNSFAIMPNSVELVAIGQRLDKKGQIVKTSDTGVQVIILDSPARK